MSCIVGLKQKTQKNHPVRDNNESFMEFIKRGSEKIKSEPTVRKMLS